MKELNSEAGVWRFGDDRVVLAIVIVLLSIFVGQTFGTTAACLSIWLASVFVVIAQDIFSRQRDRTRATEPTKRSSPLLATMVTWGRAAAVSVACVAAAFFAFSWRFAEQYTESSSVLYMTIDMIAHASVSVLGILWAAWPLRGHPLMLAIGLIVVLMTVAGGGVSSSLTGQTSFGLASILGFLVAAQVILPKSMTDEEPTRSSFARGGSVYSLISLSLMLIVASGLTQLTSRVLPSVQAAVFAQLKDRIESSSGGFVATKGRYVSGNRIGGIQETMLNDPAALALKGYCDTVPGYLRGNAFDDYEVGRWHTRRQWFRTDREGRVLRTYPSRSVQRLGRALYPVSERADPDRDRFLMDLRQFDPGFPARDIDAAADDLIDNSADDFGRDVASGPDDPSWMTIEIYGSPGKGTQVFTPATTQWIEVHGTQIRLTPHGLVDHGVDPTQPWVAGLKRQALPQRLTSADRGLLCWVSPMIRDEIEAVADSICGRSPTPRQKAAAVANHFQSQYQYTLRTESAPRGVDPIVHFLRARHPAHCELFASAATLLLRTQDVPTRYVTGYVMDELADSGDYYLARNRDAHAWVEYYDESSRTWNALECTPGRTYQTIETQSREQTQFAAGESSAEQAARADSWWLKSWGWFRSVRVTDTLALIFRILQVPLLIGLSVWLVWRMRHPALEAEEAMAIAERRRVDRRLRRLGWIRRQTETLHQFARRIETGSQDHPLGEEIRAAAAWYRGHAKKIYRPSAR